MSRQPQPYTVWPLPRHASGKLTAARCAYRLRTRGKPSYCGEQTILGIVAPCSTIIQPRCPNHVPMGSAISPEYIAVHEELKAKVAAAQQLDSEEAQP